MENIEERISAAARKIVCGASGKFTVCGAESCTGGAIASAIVSIGGASAVFKGSAVCYCDEAKMRILGVAESTLRNHFAESTECAAEMAEGARKIYNADIAFASTGFLDANTGTKPPELAGTVFLAFATKDGTSVQTLKLDSAAERNFNRKLCVLTALKKILTFGCI